VFGLGELISFRPGRKFLAFFSTALDFFVSFFIKKKEKASIFSGVNNLNAV